MDDAQRRLALRASAIGIAPDRGGFRPRPLAQSQALGRTLRHRGITTDPLRLDARRPRLRPRLALAARHPGRLAGAGAHDVKTHRASGEERTAAIESTSPTSFR